MSSLLATVSTVQTIPEALITPPAYLLADSPCPTRRPLTARLLDELIDMGNDRWEPTSGEGGAAWE